MAGSQHCCTPIEEDMQINEHVNGRMILEHIAGQIEEVITTLARRGDIGVIFFWFVKRHCDGRIDQGEMRKIAGEATRSVMATYAQPAANPELMDQFRSYLRTMFVSIWSTLQRDNAKHIIMQHQPPNRR